MSSTDKDNLDEPLDDYERFWLDVIEQGLTKAGKTWDDLSEEQIELGLAETQRIIDKSAQQFSKKMKKDIPNLLKYHRKSRGKFEKTIQEIWGKPLAILEAMLHLCSQINIDFETRYLRAAERKHEFVTLAFIRLHAKACLVSSEILVLLKSGHSDGASARWRTLHEISVVMHFIAKHGQDAAERYLLHRKVHSLKSMKQFNRYVDEINLNFIPNDYTPFTDDEISELESTCKNLSERFGEAYLNDYGWASKALDIKKPSIAQLEEDVKLGFMRPFYRTTSEAVHASTPSIFFSLGNPIEKEWLIRGASVLGLETTGQLMTLTLRDITRTLILHHRDFNGVLLLHLLEDLVNEIGPLFMDALSKLNLHHTGYEIAFIKQLSEAVKKTKKHRHIFIRVN